jgi:hypothetical protein
MEQAKSPEPDDMHLHVAGSSVVRLDPATPPNSSSGDGVADREGV